LVDIGIHRLSPIRCLVCSTPHCREKKERLEKSYTFDFVSVVVKHLAVLAADVTTATEFPIVRVSHFDKNDIIIVIVVFSISALTTLSHLGFSRHVGLLWY
jgi:hypothetical protein